MYRPLHISLVGPPGVGKSTVGTSLARELEGGFVEEDPSVHHCLAPFLRDPRRWSGLNHVDFMIEKLRVQTTIAARLPVVQEVDFEYARAVWSPALRSLGYLSPCDEAVIDRLGLLSEVLEISRPNVYLVLRADKAELEARVTTRARVSEASAVGFFDLCVAVLEQEDSFLSSVPVPSLVVDTTNASPTEVVVHVSRMLHRLQADF